VTDRVTYDRSAVVPSRRWLELGWRSLRGCVTPTIPALARWSGDHAMTKDAMTGAAVAADALLFEDWFDAIEDGVRARVRGFIETLLEEELPAHCRVRAMAGASRAKTSRRRR
jgi:hypothetical protein